MIFDKYLGFLDEFEVHVEVFTASGKVIGRGKLKIKNNSSPQVVLDDLRLKIQNKDLSHFICKSERYTYQLFDCDVYGHSINPKVIIRGSKKRSKFREVHIALQGITQWMGSSKSSEITDSEIISSRSGNRFKVEITREGKNFDLSSDNWVDIKGLGQGSHIVNEYTLLTIKTKSTSFSIIELLFIINQIRIFFSLLIGHSVGIKYVLDANDKNKTQSIYFANTTKEINDKIEKHECFVRANQLFNENKLSDLLQVYFSHENDEKRNVWGRISGMFAYEGFWEYKTLGYVSLLDRYVSIHAEDKEQCLSERKFRSCRRAAKSALNALKPPQEGAEIFNAVVESMNKQITTNIKNTSISSFGEKFYLKLSATNKDFNNILKFSDDDFGYIKNMRDSIAHGCEPDPLQEGYITGEPIITNKIAILLSYWTLIDMGLSHLDILSNLRGSLYPMIRNSRIDQKELDIALGDCLFLETNKTNFLNAQKFMFNLVLTYVKNSDTFKVNTDAIERRRNWQFNYNKSMSRSVEHELTKFVDVTKINNIAYLGNAYIKYKNESFKASGLCILNCPEHIFSNKKAGDRLIVFNDEVNAWVDSTNQHD